MNKNKNKNPIGKKSAGKNVAGDKRRRITVIAIAVGAVALILGIVLGLVLGAREFNYLEANLGRYVYISEDDYSSFPADVARAEVGEREVNRLIMNLQYKNRAKEASYDGGNVTSIPISVGDTGYIYYRGYTVDENGRESDISGATNFGSDKPDDLGIGSLSFVPGFEEGLVGIVPKDYAKFEKITSGTTVAGDVVYLTYKALLPDGSVKNVNAERIDTGLDYLGEVYGEGFAEFLLGKTVGAKIEGENYFEISGSGTALYYDMQIDYVTRCEAAPCVLETFFPANYKEKSLRGKTVFFDVYVRYTNVYDVAEFGDSFVIDVLKVSKDSLKDYTGESISEKYKAKLLSDAKETAESETKSLLEEAMWDHYLSKAEFRRLPKSEVKAIEDEYYYELERGYASYSQTYSSIEEYAIAYFGLSAGVDYKDYITEKAEGVIKEKLLFYYIAREAGLVPTEQKLAELRDELVAEYIDYYVNNVYKEDIDKLETEEERLEMIDGIKRDMFAYYGEDYFVENAYYNYALEGLLNFANK